MSNLIQLAQQLNKPTFPDFKAGDTICVHIKIQERNKERVQRFQGIVMHQRGHMLADKTFTVRKISNGIPVERILPFSWPGIKKIELLRKGLVRRAKLTYLRGKIGNAAKVKHKPFIAKKSSTSTTKQPPTAPKTNQTHLS